MMDGPVNRQFYSIPKADNFQISSIPESQSELLPYKEKVKGDSDAAHSERTLNESVNPTLTKDILSYVAENVIGSNKTFSSPYGLRTAVYLDYVASGRALQFIEDYIQNEVLPEYANTHTTTSITSLQTTLFRHEARDIIRNSCNASEHDSVIFVGSGTTGAVHKLIHSLNLTENPIVFVGPYEHHSNLLPWMEAGAEVIQIAATDSGQVNLTQLENFLTLLQPYGRRMIGAFSAASNVTGVLTDVNSVTICLHKYGALAFWDYAAAAPYVKVDMNPFVGGPQQELVYKDAVYFSVHKFVGGVDSPGVLIAKKKLFENPVPHGCGGGTVFFVRRSHHRYLQEPEVKEEGGTPNIVGAIRAGLVFQLRDAIGTDVIQTRDSDILSQAMTVWRECPNLVILGPDPLTTDRLPIVSFMVYHPTTGLFLHHNFVTAVLNDVFGIQARGGCACAGPYAMEVLGMAETVSEKMEDLLAEDSRLDRVHLRRIGEYSHREVIRPGFVRINLPYFLDSGGLDFVIEAVALVSNHAWKLLPQYLFNPETGEWRNKHFQTFKDRKWLGHISYSSGRMSYQQPAQVVKGPLPTNHQDCLVKAKEIFHHAEKMTLKVPDQSVMFDNEARPYRWFLLPSEANSCLHSKWREKPLPPSELPFCPPVLLQRLGHPVSAAQSEPNSDRILNVIATLKEQSEHELNSTRNVTNKDDCKVVPSSNSDTDVEGNVKEINVAEMEKISFSKSLVSSLDEGFELSENLDYLADSSEEVISKHSDNALRNDSGKEDVTLPRRQNDLDSAENKLDVSDSKPCVERVSGNAEASVLLDNGNSKRGESSEDSLNANNNAGLKTHVGSNTCSWFAPPKVIFKPTVQALEEYAMIQDGDKVLVCLSGGKDSLSLLHTLRQYQFYAKKKGIRYDFGAVTVDPQTPSYDPSPLKQYLAHLRVPYFYESQCIMETASNLPYECASICSFCSRMKRGRIYAAARREGYNVLAFGQHLDDLAESFMMSFLHNGSLNTMKAHYTVKEGDLRVIRPFVYVRETELRDFAEENKLPVIAENCPACFEAPKERHRTKQLLAAQEVIFPNVYSSIMAALKPLMARKRQSEDGAEEAKDAEDWDDVDL